MYKRALSAFLWLCMFLYGGALFHEIAGLHELIGPVLGLVTAGAILATGLVRRPIDLPAPSEVTGLPAGAVKRI